MFNEEPAGASPFADRASVPTWRLAPRTELLLVVAFIGLQVAILVGMIVLDGLPLLLGERIRLQVVPVDPRDLFRGDYVVLGYEYSRMSPHEITGVQWNSPNESYGGDLDRAVFVALKNAGDHYAVTGLSARRPASGTYLQGRIGPLGRVECGIEAYYVQEGEGRRLEDAIRAKRLQAEIAVWHGKAKLVRLIE
jgi:uncharacterized membrane-anchored protein